MPKQLITIIGSTGSIGQQTLEVIKAHQDKFKIFGLGAYSNFKLLEKQIKEFKPEKSAIYKTPKKISKILSGKQSWEKIATHPKVQKVVFGSQGLAALPTLLKCIKAGKQIAIANKELIVAHGAQIMKLARKYKTTIIPIDSEHSAIFQCLLGEDPKNIEKVILTCSGGPFYGKTKSELEKVTIEQTLNHPTWKMGKKISVDSATLMNKGFEIIEAMHLFNLKKEQIEIVIHPQSIVHAFVIFKDGSIKAQLSSPDMRIPIAYALAYPNRIKMDFPQIKLPQNLTFIEPDFSLLRGPQIAGKILGKNSKTAKKLLNKNDQAVKKFLKGQSKFLEIYEKL